MSDQLGTVEDHRAHIVPGCPFCAAFRPASEPGAERWLATVTAIRAEADERVAALRRVIAAYLDWHDSARRSLRNDGEGAMVTEALRAALNAAPLDGVVGDRCAFCGGPWPRKTPPRKTHCVNGHQLSEVTARERRGGGRACRICDRDAHRRKRAALDAAPEDADKP